MGVSSIPASPGHAVFGGTMSVGAIEEGAKEYSFIECEKCPAASVCKKIGNFRPSDMSKSQKRISEGPESWNKCLVANTLVNSKIMEQVEAFEEKEKKKKNEVERRRAKYEEKIQALVRKVNFLEKMLNEENK
jgi:hypothetical protein